MTVQPVLSPVLLAALAAVVIAGRIVALRQLPKSNRRALWRWGAISAAAVLLIVAAVRPVITTEDQAQAVIAGAHQPNIFLVVDRSPDMSVSDIDGQTRMQLAHKDIDALIDRYPNARFAVIEFASTASLLWPLSADSWSLRPVLSALDPYPPTPDGLPQTNVGAANNVLRYQLIGAMQQYPRAPNLVFYLGAGAPGSTEPAKEFDLPADSVDGGAVLGYGGDTGALPTVAKQIGVPFVPRTGAVPLANAVPEDTVAGSAARSTAAAGGIETYWLSALGAAVLVLIDLYLTLRDFRRSRLTGLGTPR